MYHGGIEGVAAGPVWFTTDLRNAQGWAKKAGGTVSFVDVPSDHPALGGDAEFGVLPPPNVELPADIASQRKPLDDDNARALSTRILTRAGRFPQTATPIELRPSADGMVTAYMDGKPMLASTGDPVTMAADATDLQAKRAIRNAGAISERINFYPPSRSQGTAAPRAAQPAIGDSVAIEGQAYTIEQTGNSAARLRDARGRIRTVSFDSYAWATAQVAPPAPAQTAQEAERATFDTREAAERFLSDQRRAGGARQGRALPVATADGRWTFARAGEPEFEQADQQRTEQQRAQAQQAAIDKPRQLATQAAPQRGKVLKSLHDLLANGGSLTTSMRKAGKALSDEDKRAILDRARELRGKGKPAGDAARRAVKEHIAEVMPDLVLREPGAEYTCWLWKARP